MTVQIKSAAAALAATRQTAETTAAALAEAEASRAAVAERIAALEGERAGIIAARKAGLTNHDDGARLALLAADIDGLAELLAEADAGVSAALAEAQAAANRVIAARAALDRESDAESLRRLVEHAGKMDTLMVATLREIATLTTRRGARATWFPSAELALEIRRLDLQSGHAR